uniref:Tetraspanin n=1 Tax=Oncorhynchus tshawytscha TaxID=74940 RepID=A0A8C8JU74_ONCTS
MAEGCMRGLRYGMVFFNLLFWLGGCGILGVGVWLSVTQGNFATLSSSLPSLSAANLLIVVGTIIMVIGCLGCVGAVKESRPLLLSVSILFINIHISAVSIMLYSHFYNLIDHYAQRDLKRGLQLFGTEGNVGLTNAWMIVQTDFRCCGVTNHTDWFDVYNASRVPDSCCLEYSDNCGLENPGTWWTAPCYERVKDWLQENLVALWIFAMCTALTQILGLVFSMTMFCHAVKVETFYA